MRLYLQIRRYFRDTVNNKFLLFVIFNIVIGSLLTFFDRQGGLAYFRAVVVYLILATLLISRNCFKVSAINIVYWLSFYFFIFIFFSSNLPRSISLYFKVIASLLLLPISISYMTKPSNLLKFLSFTKFAFIYFIGFAIISTVFGVGWNQYARDDQTSSISLGFGDSQLYTFSLALVVMPFYKKYSTDKIGILFYVIMLICFLMLVFSMRRTSVIIVILGYFLYFIFSAQLTKLIKIFLLGGLILILSFPLYQDVLMQRLSLRKYVMIDESYSLDKEGRWQETILIWNDIVNYDKLTTVVFGKELFNSPGNYGGGRFGLRMLHIDYNRILHGSGILGLGLYLLMYLLVFKTFYFFYKRSKLKIKKDIRALFLTFYILSLFISFSGQMDDLTFRSVLFIILGGCIGILKRSLTLRYKRILINKELKVNVISKNE